MITVCMAYYENPGMLALQLDNFESMPQDIRDHLEYIVVDDGSTTKPASEVWRKIGMRTKLYRMLVDIRWNQDACRNLAAANARNPWLLLTDMDHMPPEATMRAVLDMQRDPTNAYRFSRVTAPEMTEYKPHPNSWLLTREKYDAAGGYDERFAGIYGTDGMFVKRLRDVAEIVPLPYPLVRYPRTHVPDASTTTYERKTPRDAEEKDRVTAEIEASGDLTPHRLTFPWERVC